MVVHSGRIWNDEVRMRTAHSRLLSAEPGLSPGLELSTLSGVGIQGWLHRQAAKPTPLLGLCVFDTCIIPADRNWTFPRFCHVHLVMPYGQVPLAKCKYTTPHGAVIRVV
jgi:hypothetical protein